MYKKFLLFLFCSFLLLSTFANADNFVGAVGFVGASSSNVIDVTEVPARSYMIYNATPGHNPADYVGYILDGFLTDLTSTFGVVTFIVEENQALGDTVSFANGDDVVVFIGYVKDEGTVNRRGYYAVVNHDSWIDNNGQAIIGSTVVSGISNGVIATLNVREVPSPNAVLNVAGDQVDLSWTALVEDIGTPVNRDNIVGYDILRSESPTSNFVKINTATITGTTYSDTNLDPDKTYYYALRPVYRALPATATSNVYSANSTPIVTPADVSDTKAPVIYAHNPTDNETDVAREISIAFSVTDNHAVITNSGVDFSTLSVLVNGVNYDSGFVINGDSVKVPTINFNYGQMVNVTINVSDISGNATVNAYSFAIEQAQIIGNPFANIEDYMELLGDTVDVVNELENLGIIDGSGYITTDTSVYDPNNPSINSSVIGGQVGNVIAILQDILDMPKPADTFDVIYSQVSPQPGSTDVPQETAISFIVSDYISGVATDSIEIIVNDTIYTASDLIIEPVAGDPYSYQVTVPTNNYIALSDVSITVNVSDISGNAITDPDPALFTIAPAVIVGNPFADIETDNSLAPLTILDELKDKGYVNASNEITSLYDPLNPNIDLVDTSVISEDLHGEIIAILQGLVGGTFEDTVAPAISDRIPGAGSVSSERSLPIVFTVKDSNSGVDIDGIVIKVNGSTMSRAWFGSLRNYTVTVPTQNFNYGQTVTVDITVSDISGNVTNEVYSFSIIADTTAPSVVSTTPANGASGVAQDTSIILDMTDDLTGIDISSLEVLVNGSARTYSSVMNDTEGLDYTVTIATRNYVKGSTVMVTVNVEDKSGNLATYEFSFKVESLVITSNIFADLEDQNDLADGSILAELVSGGYLDANTPNPGEWTVTDKYLSEDPTSNLADIDDDGAVNASIQKEIIKIMDKALGKTAAYNPPQGGYKAYSYPNPASPMNGDDIKLKISLDKDGDYDLYLINMVGHVVWKYKGVGDAGINDLDNGEFTGKNSWGNILPNGVYLLRVVQGDKVVSSGKISILD